MSTLQEKSTRGGDFAVGSDDNGGSLHRWSLPAIASNLKINFRDALFEFRCFKPSRRERISQICFARSRMLFVFWEMNRAKAPGSHQFSFLFYYYHLRDRYELAQSHVSRNKVAGSLLNECNPCRSNNGLVNYACRIVALSTSAFLSAPYPATSRNLAHRRFFFFRRPGNYYKLSLTWHLVSRAAVRSEKALKSIRPMELQSGQMRRSWGSPLFDPRDVLTRLVANMSACSSILSAYLRLSLLTSSLRTTRRDHDVRDWRSTERWR